MLEFNIMINTSIIFNNTIQRCSHFLATNLNESFIGKESWKYYEKIYDFFRKVLNGSLYQKMCTWFGWNLKSLTKESIQICCTLDFVTQRKGIMNINQQASAFISTHLHSWFVWFKKIKLGNMKIKSKHIDFNIAHVNFRFFTQKC